MKILRGNPNSHHCNLRGISSPSSSPPSASSPLRDSPPSFTDLSKALSSFWSVCFSASSPSVVLAICALGRGPEGITSHGKRLRPPPMLQKSCIHWRQVTDSTRHSNFWTCLSNYCWKDALCHFPTDNMTRSIEYNCVMVQESAVNSTKLSALIGQISFACVQIEVR